MIRKNSCVILATRPVPRQCPERVRAACDDVGGPRAKTALDADPFTCAGLRRPQEWQRRGWKKVEWSVPSRVVLED